MHKVMIFLLLFVPGVLCSDPVSPDYIYLHIHTPTYSSSRPQSPVYTHNYGSQTQTSLQPEHGANYGSQASQTTFPSQNGAHNYGSQTRTSFHPEHGANYGSQPSQTTFSSQNGAHIYGSQTQTSFQPENGANYERQASQAKFPSENGAYNYGSQIQTSFQPEHGANYGNQASQTNFPSQNEAHNYGSQTQTSFQPIHGANYGSRASQTNFPSENGAHNSDSQAIKTKVQTEHKDKYGNRASQSFELQHTASQASQASYQPLHGANGSQGGKTNFQNEYSWQSQWQHKYDWTRPGPTNVQSYTAPTYEVPSLKPESSNQAAQVMVKPLSSDQTGGPTYNPFMSNLRPVSPGLDPGNSTTKPFLPQDPKTMSQSVTLGELYTPSLPWHVGIYIKIFTPYMQMCGGSIVKPDVVLSAAHCFWNEDVGALGPGLFSVAAGKLLKPWQTEGEIYTQHSDVKAIKIPPRFLGRETNFQDDIAIVFLSKPLEYTQGVRPICISFDLGLERNLLTSGNLGTIAGWSLTANGHPSTSQQLNFLKLPYVDIQECIRTADPGFLKYITSDKICAGDQKSGICLSDSGGGLAYYSGRTPYLVGVASAPRDECYAHAVAGFTHVRAHRAFLEEHVLGIGEGCRGLYENS